MTIIIQDATQRPIEIEANNAGCPGSVFLAVPGGTYEIDRAALVQALGSELGLVDPLEEAFKL